MLATQFAERRDLLKARSALLAIDLVLTREPRPAAAPLAAEVERILAGAHEFAELRLLSTLRSGAVKLPAEVLQEAERLLGGDGGAAAGPARAGPGAGAGRSCGRPRWTRRAAGSGARRARCPAGRWPTSPGRWCAAARASWPACNARARAVEPLLTASTSLAGHHARAPAVAEVTPRQKGGGWSSGGGSGFGGGGRGGSVAGRSRICGSWRRSRWSTSAAVSSCGCGAGSGSGRSGRIGSPFVT